MALFPVGHDLFACPRGFGFLWVFLEAAFSVALSVQCQSAKLKPRFVAGGVCLWLQDPEGLGLHGTRQTPVYREASNTATFLLLPPFTPPLPYLEDRGSSFSCA